MNYVLMKSFYRYVEKSSRFIMICFLENNKLYWLNAGHPAPVIISKNGDLSQLNGTGPLLGLSNDHQYTLYEAKLDNVEHIILYTDGWTDNRFTDKDEMTELKKIIPTQSTSAEDFAHSLWKNSQVALSKEVDDASLIIAYTQFLFRLLMNTLLCLGPGKVT